MHCVECNGVKTPPRHLSNLGHHNKLDSELELGDIICLIERITLTLECLTFIARLLSH